MRRTLEVPTALVSLVDDERQFFPGAAGLPAQLEDVRETPLSHSFCQHVVVTREPLVVEDARTDARVLDNHAIAELGLIAYAGVPLVDADGRVLGSLCAIDYEPRAWSSEDLAVLNDLGAACSSELQLRTAATGALRLGRAAEEAKRRAEASSDRLALLASVTQGLTRGGHQEARLREVAALLVPALADDVALDLLEEETVRRIAAVGAAPARPSARLPDWPEPARRVLRGLSSAAEDSDGRTLVLPLAVPGRVHGALSLTRGAERSPFAPATRALAQELVRRLAVHVENARLLSQQRRASELFQLSLLHRPPPPPDLRIAVHYQPAAAHAFVGGDWYDAFGQPDGGAVVVVGDVSGHDLAAAARMGQLRNLVRGTVYDRPESPAQGLARVDRALVALAVSGLATAVIVRLEPPRPDGGRCLRWSNAGHLPPVLVGADGRARLLEAGEPDLLLGLDPDLPRHDHEVDLAAGATLVLCTDGLVERRSSSLGADLERLRATLEDLGGLEPEALRQALLERLLPEASDDDVALVVVRGAERSAA